MPPSATAPLTFPTRGSRPLDVDFLGGRLTSDGGLASQPTFSRLENVVGARICYRLAEALGAVSLQERERDGAKVRFLEETRFLAERTPRGGGRRDASQGDQHALRGDHPR